MPPAIADRPLRPVNGLTETLCVVIGGWSGGETAESFDIDYANPASDNFIPPPTGGRGSPLDPTPTAPRDIRCHIERTGASPAAYTGVPPTVAVWYKAATPAESTIKVTVPASFPTDARVIVTARYYPSPVGR